MFLLLCEFRRNKYLLQSWRAIYMLKRPYVACVGLIFFGVRAVLGLDAYGLFLQHVLACVHFARKVGVTLGSRLRAPWQR